jgi:hypothetical protein
VAFGGSGAAVEDRNFIGNGGAIAAPFYFGTWKKPYGYSGIVLWSYWEPISSEKERNELEEQLKSYQSRIEELQARGEQAYLSTNTGLKRLPGS